MEYIPAGIDRRLRFDAKGPAGIPAGPFVFKKMPRAQKAAIGREFALFFIISKSPLEKYSINMFVCSMPGFDLRVR
jgi:hypothetical protein